MLSRSFALPIIVSRKKDRKGRESEGRSTLITVPRLVAAVTKTAGMQDKRNSENALIWTFPVP